MGIWTGGGCGLSAGFASHWTYIASRGLPARHEATRSSPMLPRQVLVNTEYLKIYNHTAQPSVQSFPASAVVQT